MNHAGPGHNMRFSDIVLDDPELSMAAKGVFAILGLLGSGARTEALAQHARDEADAVSAAVEELVRAGYVRLEGEAVHVNRPGSFGLPS